MLYAIFEDLLLFSVPFSYLGFGFGLAAFIIALKNRKKDK